MSYDNINDRVATYTDHDGRAWRLDNPSRNEAVRKVTLHGPYPDWNYEFDADHGGRLTARSLEGKTQRYGYNTAGFLSEQTNENGHKATFTTDDRGNVLSRTTCRTADSCQTSYSTYFLNSANKLDPRNDRKLTDSDARSTGPTDTTYRTTYEYDTVGRLISTTYPRPNGFATNPTETWRYSRGLDPADGGGTIPAGLLMQHNGKRADGVTTYLYRANGDLAEQTSPTGLRTRFTYDAIGRKRSVTTMIPTGAPFGTTEYTYTSRSQVDTVTGPVARNTLTGVDHRVLTKYGYDSNGNTTQITLTDTAGADPPRTTTHEYNEHDQLVATTMPDGGRVTREYRHAGTEIRTTDQRGTVWTEIFDPHGRSLRKYASGTGVDPQDPSMTVLVSEVRNYDLAGRLGSSRDAMGRETQYTYYDDDRLATVTRSGVLTEQREYDPAGHVTKVTTAGGRVATATYDPAGFPATTTLDPTGLNRVTHYLRDADGQVNKASRTGAADPGRTENTYFGYNANGQLLREDAEFEPGGMLSVTYSLDERGLPIKRDDRRRMTTDFSYDAYGRVVTETQPEMETWVGGQRRPGVRPEVTNGYNAFGDLTHQRDPNGAVTVFGYDIAGRLTSTQQPDYAPPGGQPIRAVSRVEYDKLGNPIKTTDPLGRAIERGYDPHGRVVAETVPPVGNQARTTKIGYYRDGELASLTDPAGNTRLSTYDDLGRKITDTAVERQPQPTYFATQYGYDNANNLTTVTTPTGSITRSTFNTAGEPLTVADPTGRVTSYSYDMAGRQVSSTEPTGVVTRTNYDLLGQATDVIQLAGNPLVEQRRSHRDLDANGNVLAATSPEGRTKSFVYDTANRPYAQNEKIDATKTIHTSFGYDAAGNRTRFVDGNGHATTYTYNTWGLPESTVEPGGSTWTTTYDAAAQQVEDRSPGDVKVTSEYDARGRLTIQRGTGAEAPTADKTFGYDPAGRMTSFGSTALTYDDRGNLSTIRGPSGDATFTYTADSQLATRADLSGTASYTYDAAGRPLSIVDSLSGRTIDYTYNPSGLVAYTAERGLERNLKRLRTYDALARPTSDSALEFDPEGMPPRVIVGTEYSYDRDDNITGKKTTTNNQSKANTYGYDGANRLVSWTSATGTTNYEWDNAGNRTRAGQTTFTYNDRNQLTSDGTTQYSYTPRGTLAGAGARAPKFDAFDQLVQEGVVNYTYDSLGRVSQRGGTALSYGSLSNDVVSDGSRLVSRDPSGEPLSDKAISASTPGKLLYADMRGDVVGTWRGAALYGQRTFDPFGRPTSSGGEQPSLGYQGEWTEPSTGAVNMHARWYSPETATFTSRDTVAVAPDPSVAGNRYSYANANPLANGDPSGHGPISNLLCRVFGIGCYGNNGDDAESPKPPKPVPPVKGSATATINTPGGGKGPGSGSGHGPSGGGHGPGSGPGINPPPPLWQRNTKNAPPRPNPGTTTPVRPPTTSVDGWERVTIIDNTLLHAEQNTHTTTTPSEGVTILAGMEGDNNLECVNGVNPNGKRCGTEEFDGCKNLVHGEVCYKKMGPMFVPVEILDETNSISREELEASAHGCDICTSRLENGYGLLSSILGEVTGSQNFIDCFESGVAEACGWAALFLGPGKVLGLIGRTKPGLTGSASSVTLRTVDDMLARLSAQGVKHTPENIVRIAQDGSGKIFFLEKGNSKAGLEHIISRHGGEFAQAGIAESAVPDLVIAAATRGKIVGAQGRGDGRPIYEIFFNGQLRRVAVTTGDNGFIVGANIAGR